MEKGVFSLEDVNEALKCFNLKPTTIRLIRNRSSEIRRSNLISLIRSRTELKTADFNYPLPPERIAQTPIEPRDSSRLFVYNRKTDRVEHRHFRDIGDYLNPGDLLVRNQTKVLPARIYGKKESGGKVELLLLRKRTDSEWECLIGGKKIREGAKIVLSDNLFALVLTNADSPRRTSKIGRASCRERV